MKERNESQMHYPETPAWTMFFDGPLYEKYAEFMRNKDFSKILLTDKLKLANLPPSETGESQGTGVTKDWWEDVPDTEENPDPEAGEQTHTYSNVPSKETYRKFKEEEKRRTRRTRALIFLGVFIIAALVLGTALVIHYFFVKPQEDPKSQVNVSFSGNTSIFDGPETSKTPPTKLDTLLEGDSGKKIDKKPDPRILNPTGMIFDDHDFVRTLTSATTLPPAKDTDDPRTITSSAAKTTSEAQSTTEMTTTQKSIPSSTSVGSVSTTTQNVATKTSPTKSTSVDPLDFFAMDMDFTSSTAADTSTTGSVPVSTEATTKSAFAEGPLSLSSNVVASTSSVAPKTTSESDQILSNTSVEVSASASTTPVGQASKPVHLSTTVITESKTITSSYGSTVTEVTTAASGDTLVSSTTQKEENVTTVSPESSTAATEMSTPNITATSAVKTTTGFQSSAPSSPSSSAPTTKDIKTASSASVNAMEISTPLTREVTNATISQTTFLETTTVTPTETTSFVNFNSMNVHDITSYSNENTQLKCDVQFAKDWTSLSIRDKSSWHPLQITLFPSGRIRWSSSKTSRHDVISEITKESDWTGSNVTLILVIQDVQCKDGNMYICELKSSLGDVIKLGRLSVVGKPGDRVELTLGPSLVEDRAFRLTARWKGGYPVPWSEIFWSATDARNQSFDLTKFGEYRDYDLIEDHQNCQTTLTLSIVIFPPMVLNGSRVEVKPDVTKAKSFLDTDMKTLLYNVKPAYEQLLIIPIDYCKDDVKDKSVPHPYVTCTKFVRCLPGNLVVQMCPQGTCFYERMQECA